MSSVTPPRPLEGLELFVQMGRSHPATHGTVRMNLKLDGKIVTDVDLEIGYLHRGFEKMCEQSTYNQVFPYTDRLNYVSPAINNVGFALTVEKLLNLDVPERTQYIRTIISEVSRVQDHLSYLAATARELGGATALRWAVEARDHYYNLFEELTGARVTLSYCRVGGARWDLSPGFEEKFGRCAAVTEKLMVDIERLVHGRGSYLDRLRGVGVIPREVAIEYGFTGPCLRASGADYDVRKDFPYLIYDRLDFDVPIGDKGDNYDRYLVRMEEIRQSLRMVRQCFKQIPGGPVNAPNWQIVHPPKDEVHNTIEGMIAQFELVVRGPMVPPGEVYGFVEGGNGELGFYLVSDGRGGPYRLHVRAPCFALMQGLPYMLKGGKLADIVPTSDSINMIGGEIDR